QTEGAPPGPAPAPGPSRNRRPAATHGGAIDDVVMHEGGGMRQLHGHRGGSELREIVRADLGREQDERRPDALTTGGEQVGHRGGDDVGVCGDRFMQAGLDGSEVPRDGTKQARLRGYVACFSQSCTSCARTPSPKMLAAIRSNCCGTAVTNISCRGVASPARSLEWSRCRSTLAAVVVAESTS